MNTWLLLEHSDELLPRLYRQVRQPGPIRLFDSTEFAPYREQSPLLIEAPRSSALFTAVRSTPEHWPGLIIDSAAPGEHLLAHLRHRLFIRFGADNRKGLLRYWSPSTASYFFPACAPENLELWLGPISHLSWYGATWPEIAKAHRHWHDQANHRTSTWQPEARAPSFALTAELEQALKRQRLEYQDFLDAPPFSQSRQVQP